MIKVEATKEWKICNLKCKDFRPERIPNEGEQWEVDEIRLEVLLGKNSYDKAFVKVVDETITTTTKLYADGEVIATDVLVEVSESKPIKKTTTKKQPKKK